MTSTTDIKIASLAAGFTLGFGFLTCWEAIKQTQRNRNPLRSAYIYMIWGEIVANLAIGLIGWLFLDGIVGPTVPVLFFLLLCWVFEIQLLMQIIINRIAVVAENQQTISRLKWGTAAIITVINIAVFCIWIPSHTVPPSSDLIVKINHYWDRTSKVLILIVDAGLNWYFLHIVKKRLVDYYRLKKYAPLVSFNAKLMVLSIAMDALLIGLMSLPNQVVFVQFHPVVYMVKLNIEMSMASLITRLAARKMRDADEETWGITIDTNAGNCNQDMELGSQFNHSEATAQGCSSIGIGANMNHDVGVGIQRKVDVEITFQDRDSEFGKSRNRQDRGDAIVSRESTGEEKKMRKTPLEDERILTQYAGNPANESESSKEDSAKDLSDSETLQSIKGIRV